MRSEPRPDRARWWSWFNQTGTEQRKLELRLLPHLARAYRALLQMSQADLADRANISRKTVNSLEGGLRQPDEKTCEAIKNAMIEAGMSVDIIDKNLVIRVPVSSLEKGLLDDFPASRSDGYQKVLHDVAQDVKRLVIANIASNGRLDID
jgi:DNA-binding XRE family transcriptional regulator